MVLVLDARRQERKTHLFEIQTPLPTGKVEDPSQAEACIYQLSLDFILGPSPAGHKNPKKQIRTARAQAAPPGARWYLEVLAILVVGCGQHDAQENVHGDADEGDEEEGVPVVVGVCWHPAGPRNTHPITASATWLPYHLHRFYCAGGAIHNVGEVGGGDENVKFPVCVEIVVHVDLAGLVDKVMPLEKRGCEEREEGHGQKEQNNHTEHTGKGSANASKDTPHLEKHGKDKGHTGKLRKSWRGDN
jgi:hypothetical protein